MNRWLLAAEADQIQDLIFRASRLREVVGGSQLLTRFCREGAEELLRQLGGSLDDLIIHDGGAFRITFDDAQRAEEFGSNLSDLYRRCAGGSLTVAKPVEYDAQKFKEANRAAHLALNEAKSIGHSSATTAHLPYLAFCASCGIALAVKRHERGDRENYYCVSCLMKEDERNEENRKIREENDLSGFLGKFKDAVDKACKSAKFDFAGYQFPQEAEDVAAFDLTGRRYVAYLLADGNGMGALFGECQSKEQMIKLSKALPEAMRESLAVQCPDLLKRIEPQNEKKILPVLPLILGGDDLLALLPATWAIDIAARFCRKYEELMAARLGEEGMPQTDQSPTITAAVVICKGSYPHALAHRQGEELLKQAKQFARGLEVKTGKRVSAIGFALISGNEVGKPLTVQDGAMSATACPYFVNELDDDLKNAGLPVTLLHRHRLSLTKAKLPAKRRAELERLYDDAARIGKIEELEAHWSPRLLTLLERIKRRSGEPRQNGHIERKTPYQALMDAVRDLGNGQDDEQARKLGYCRAFERPFETNYGHGLADLLAIWDYAYDVTLELNEYQE